MWEAGVWIAGKNNSINNHFEKKYGREKYKVFIQNLMRQSWKKQILGAL